MKQVTCSGTVRVPLPPAQARALFTAEGERAWAPGWDPDYPEVRCAPDGVGTRAEVTYDLTALGPDADLAGFRAGFPAMLAAWEASIAAAL